MSIDWRPIASAPKPDPHAEPVEEAPRILLRFGRLLPQRLPKHGNSFDVTRRDLNPLAHCEGHGMTLEEAALNLREADSAAREADAEVDALHVALGAATERAQQAHDRARKAAVRLCEIASPNARTGGQDD